MHPLTVFAFAVAADILEDIAVAEDIALEELPVDPLAVFFAVQYIASRRAVLEAVRTSAD